MACRKFGQVSWLALGRVCIPCMSWPVAEPFVCQMQASKVELRGKSMFNHITHQLPDTKKLVTRHQQPGWFNLSPGQASPQ